MNNTNNINTIKYEKLPCFIRAAFQIMKEANFELWLVGGIVRDKIISQIYESNCDFKYNDVDMATNADWQSCKKLFERHGWTVYETGTLHGTISVITPKRYRINNKISKIEITTFRSDGQYLDYRHPSTVKYEKTIIKDLARRDFTINAIAYCPENGIIDPYCGINDINNKVIKAVGEPTLRFSEDALRILRGIRFAGKLGFTIENKTIKSMYEKKHLLKKLSGERIHDEMSKLLLTKHIAKILITYNKIICELIPELLPSVGFNQKTKYHNLDVYQHIAYCVGYLKYKHYYYLLDDNKARKISAILKWSALLHDIGKPKCFTLDDNGQGHFYGHPKISEEISHNILKRFCFSRKDKKIILCLIKYHDYPTKNTKKSVLKMLKRLANELPYFDTFLLFNMLCDLREADSLAHHPNFRENAQIIDNIKSVAREICQDNDAFSIAQLKINGNEIMSLGVEQGKHVKEILQNCLDQVIDGNLNNNKTELINYVNEMLIRKASQAACRKS